MATGESIATVLQSYQNVPANPANRWVLRRKRGAPKLLGTVAGIPRKNSLNGTRGS